MRPGLDLDRGVTLASGSGHTASYCVNAALLRGLRPRASRLVNLCDALRRRSSAARGVLPAFLDWLPEQSVEGVAASAGAAE